MQQQKLCQTCPLVEPSRVDAGNGWVSHHGKAESVLLNISDASVDALVTDPPYGSGANSVAGRLKASSSKYRSSDAKPLPDIHGDSLLPEAWSQMIYQVLQHAHRVLKPGAPAVMFCDWRSLPGMLGVVGAVGFGVKSCVVWDKGRGSRPVQNGFRLQSELALFARKGGPMLPPGQPVYLDGVLRYSTMGSAKQHLTQKPLALMRDLLRIVPTGGTILDPFQGAGSTGVAALEAGCQYIGIESVAAYHEIAVTRLRETEATTSPHSPMSDTAT